MTSALSLPGPWAASTWMKGCLLLIFTKVPSGLLEALQGMCREHHRGWAPGPGGSRWEELILIFSHQFSSRGSTCGDPRLQTGLESEPSYLTCRQRWGARQAAVFGGLQSDSCQTENWRQFCILPIRGKHLVFLSWSHFSFQITDYIFFFFFFPPIFIEKSLENKIYWKTKRIMLTKALKARFGVTSASTFRR